MSNPLPKRQMGAPLSCLLAGILAALSLPPFHLVPVLALAFPLFLIRLAQADSKKQAFVLGWAFGFGYFVAGLYWIGHALAVDIGRFWWLMPFAVAGLPCVLAVYIGLIAVIWHVLTGGADKQKGVAACLVWAVLWMLAESLRGAAFTGFPWNIVAVSWLGFLPVAQSVAVIGGLGLGMLTVALASLPAAMLGRGWDRRLAMPSMALGVMLFMGLAAWGQSRLDQGAGLADTTTKLRLVQPGFHPIVAEATESSRAQRNTRFQSLLKLTASLPREVLDPNGPWVIWPETAVPFFMDQDLQLRLEIASVTPPGRAVLTGVPTEKHTMQEGGRIFYNSLYAVDSNGAILARYHKSHLVPFGEYVPGRAVLSRFIPIEAIATGATDFSPGPGPVTMRLPGLPPFSPLICYESIFDGGLVDPADRPEWLLNITNDSWYGYSTGPWQHLSLARLRAMEQGLPLVRVATNGVSVVTDPMGQIRHQLPWRSAATADVPLPQTLSAVPLYARYHPWPPYILGLGVLVLAWFMRRKTDVTKK
ncbi:MAG: apolipoprotein N-acyltransferase [Alphaproteobacteria bacterium]|nr:MAG: apolipoprotein N-acyltransferase [Alphaproteobacteria bacterium]